ncbi:hypothetical protein SOASR032_02530 [Pragia fontium]|uniref:Uncharacterized protein n=1 Tax=Pragia fontium TaxID=82985 RepID=A0ABQ5LED5_9GAMM|nr:hypothetical protein SOASR032_02530 [Pragia fontium]
MDQGDLIGKTEDDVDKWVIKPVNEAEYKLPLRNREGAMRELIAVNNLDGQTPTRRLSIF